MFFNSEDDSCSSESSLESSHSFREKLREWALDENITIQSLSRLLSLLNPIIPELPLDGRTLLNANTKCEIVPMGEGEYIYFGIANFIPHGSNVFDLELNVDGLPIFKSSKKQFWPILGSFGSTVFIIAIYFGTSKPCSIDSFFKDFISEVNNLSNVRVVRFVCDGPAKSFIKQMKYPNSYHSCNHCNIKGKYDEIVCFKEIGNTMRTDYSFREKLDRPHHKDTTPLVNLPIDMVHAFPFDYMHVVCLGVVKRLLRYWMEGPLKQQRISANHQLQISNKLLSLRSCFPSDFSRKPRPLTDVKFWKATEFRTFLLNTGVIVLKDVVDSKVYNHFLLLHIGIRLLCDPLNYSENLVSAHSCLQKFVKKCSKLYGDQMLVSNVHALLHLADDCSRHGTLDEFSAFKFENEMQVRNIFYVFNN